MTVLRVLSAALMVVSLTTLQPASPGNGTTPEPAIPQTTAAAAATVLPAASTPSPNYTINVTGNCVGNGSCAQNVVNHNSFSYISYSGWGFSEIAGHNYGPAGVIANFRPGTVVKVNGHGSGIYRVTKLVYVGKVTSVASIPKGFAFQTCVGSRMVLAYASKITTTSAAPAKVNQPNGRLDRATVNSDGTVSLSGWAFDKDAKNAQTSVHVYIDGKARASVAANGSRADVKKAYKLSSDKVGYSWKSSALSIGNHKVQVYAINRGPGSNKLIATKTVTVKGNQPTGRLDHTTVNSDGTVTVSGWAFDKDAKDAQTSVHVYIDGKMKQAVAANGSRADVKKAYKLSSDKVGYSWKSSTLSIGTHEVKVYAINQGMGSDKLIASKKFTVSGHVPTGKVEDFTTNSNGTTMTGWAFDPDTKSAPTTIVVNIDGKNYSVGQTSVSRADVKAKYDLGTDKVGFSWVLPKLGIGTHEVKVYAMNTGAGADTLIGSKTLTVKDQTPRGNLTSFNVSSGSVNLNGWAFDPDETGKQTTILVAIDGVKQPTFVTNVSLSAIQQANNLDSDKVGFNWTSVQLPAGAHTLKVYALNHADGAETLLNTIYVNIAAPVTQAAAPVSAPTQEAAPAQEAEPAPAQTVDAAPAQEAAPVQTKEAAPEASTESSSEEAQSGSSE